MYHHRKLKKWLREEYLKTHADFDGFQAKGNFDMLRCFICHYARVDFGGPFPGRCPNGYVKVTSNPWFVFVREDHKEELLETFTDHRRCAPDASNDDSCIMKHPVTTSGEDLLKYMRDCDIDEFIVKGYGMKSKITWGHSLLSRALIRDPNCEMHYDVALNIEPHHLTKFVEDQSIHKRSHQHDRRRTMNESTVVISDEENSSDEEEDSAGKDDEEDSTGHPSHQNQGNGRHPQTQSNRHHHQIAESMPSLSDEPHYITLVKCEDSKKLKQQLGRQTSISHYPFFANAQAEHDSFKGETPLRGSLFINKKQRHDAQDDGRFRAGKVYSTHIHTPKNISRQNMNIAILGMLLRKGWSGWTKPITIWKASPPAYGLS